MNGMCLVQQTYVYILITSRSILDQDWVHTSLNIFFIWWVTGPAVSHPVIGCPVSKVMEVSHAHAVFWILAGEVRVVQVSVKKPCRSSRSDA